MSDRKFVKDVSLMCPICIETFKSPRLTACQHSFCEQCLFTYVSTLKDKRELGISFPCPVCRHGVTGPPDGHVSMSWIQTLPVNKELVKMITEIPGSKERGKEDTPTPLCEPCAAEDEHNRAVKFCIDCRESLCKACVDIHRKYKTLKGHTLVQVRKQGNMIQMKDISVAVDIKCGKHRNKDVEVYCASHDIYCCVTCVTLTHRDCSGVMDIPDMEEASSKTMARLKSNFEVAEKHLEQVRVGHIGSISKFPDSIDKVQNLFMQKREEILRSLDDIQTMLNIKKKQLITSIERKAGSMIARVDNMKERCRQNIDKIDILNDYSLSVHKVVIQKDMVQEYIKLEQEMDTGEMNGEEFHVKWVVLAKLADIHKEIVACKNEVLTVETGNPSGAIKCEDILNKMKDKRVVKGKEDEVIADPVVPMTTGTIRYEVVRNDSHGNTLERRICLYDSQLTFRGHLKSKTGYPFGAAVLKTNPQHIAISVPNDKQIHIISEIDNALTIIKSFTTNRTPYSLTSLDGGHLGVTWDYPPSFDIVDISGAEMKTVRSYLQDSRGRKFKSFKYVAVDEFRSHIIQPCTKDNAVYCFDFSGNPVFKYEDDQLRWPWGVDIDGDGNVYICCGNTRKIRVLSPSGRKIKDEGIPYEPLAICFNKTKDGFCVVGKPGLFYLGPTVCFFSMKD